MSGGEGALDTPGGPLNDSGEKYAVCFFDNNNTVGKHLFFLIQSILLFHDRCCFTFERVVTCFDRFKRVWTDLNGLKRVSTGFNEGEGEKGGEEGKRFNRYERVSTGLNVF